MNSGQQPFLWLTLAIICLTSAATALATDISREPWHWNSKMPASILPDNPPATRRDPRIFEHLHLGRNTTMKQLITRIGVPDAFAPQYIVTRTMGTPVGLFKGGPEAGTFRYLLQGGGEAFIQVSDLRTIEAVIRSQKDEDCNVLYERDEP